MRLKSQSNLDESSARINIYGQETELFCVCDEAKDVIINRSFPDILNEIVSQNSWTTFCENIDKALEPMVAIRNNITRMWKLKIANIIIFILIVGFVYLNSILRDGSFMLMPIAAAPILIIFVLGCCDVNTKSRAQKVLKNVKRVCAQMNSEHQDVTFRMMRDFAPQRSLYRMGRDRHNAIYIELVLSDDLDA